MDKPMGGPTDSERLREIAAMELWTTEYREWFRTIAARLDAAPAPPGVPAEVREAADRLDTDAGNVNPRDADIVSAWILSQPAALSPPPREQEEN